MTTEQLRHFEEREREPKSKIALHFFRHSIREKTGEQLLTPEGRKLAKERASKDTDIKQSVAFGSPRPRTQETAGFRMAGAEDAITGTETLGEPKEKLDKDLALVSKIGIDERLDFSDDYATPYGKEFYRAFGEGVFLKFLVERSDRLADELGDERGETCSRMASRIAEIVKKYVTIAPRWNELAQDESKQYGDTLERFLASHQGVTESFLAKVIELTKGATERDVFVAALNSQGFDVEIKSQGVAPEAVQIAFRKEKDGKIVFEYDETVPMEVIDAILQGATK